MSTQPANPAPVTLGDLGTTLQAGAPRTEKAIAKMLLKHGATQSDLELWDQVWKRHITAAAAASPFGGVGPDDDGDHAMSDLLRNLQQCLTWDTWPGSRLPRSRWPRTLPMSDVMGWIIVQHQEHRPGRFGEMPSIDDTVWAWNSVTPHGWLFHAAQVSPLEAFDPARRDEWDTETLGMVAILRGIELPALPAQLVFTRRPGEPT